MYQLTFHRDGKALSKRSLGDVPILIGRDPSCDIELVEEDISRIHARIFSEDGVYKIEDKSTNGIFINGKKVESAFLKENDKIKIGSWQIIFEKSRQRATEETVIKDYTPTRVLKFESSKKELSTENLELLIETSSGKNKYLITDALIGSDKECTIQITGDQYISSKHCRIVSGEDGYFIEDLGSKNGTSLGDRKITRSRLPLKGEIVIGKSKIYFAVKKSLQKIEPAALTSLGPIIGKSNAIREIYTLIQKITPSSATVCITGESGTGKELVARLIHDLSTRRKMPFIALNCGAIPANLIESELFGHEKGSFTNATGQHKGVFEQANCGTLFLDEIGEMPLELQTRLLRVLETRHLRRVGGNADIPVDVRIIAATNQNLGQLVRDKSFREDLFFRLFVIPIAVPPLRDRKDDIALLAEHFLSELNIPSSPKKLSEGAINKLSIYNWPGNVRELKNTIQRSIIVSTDNTIVKEDIVFTEIKTSVVDKLPFGEQKKTSIVTALRRANGNSSEAARQLGISRTTLASMVKRFSIDIGELKFKS